MIYLLIVVTTAVSTATVNGRSIEYSLHEKIFNGYDKNIRPVANMKDIVVVKIQPIIYSLIEVDERIGTMEFIQWLEMSWRDAYLRWNRSEFENMLSTHIPTHNMWMPDISILNQMTDISYSLARDDTLAEVLYDGTVIAAFLQTLKIRCHRFDLSKFPFDQQSCFTLYSSWTYNNEELILTHAKVIEQDQIFRPHNEWDIVSFLPSLDNTSYTSMVQIQEGNGSQTLLNYTGYYGEVWYNLTLKRKPFYYIFTLVIPSIITTSICLIGLFNPFDTDGHREEKVTLGLTTMLAMTMILVLVANSMPRGGGSQLLGNYILFEISLCTFATVTTVVIMCWHQRMELQATEPPKRLLRFVYLALCIQKRHDHAEELSVDEQSRKQNEAEYIRQFDNNNIMLKIKSPLIEDRALQQLYKITENIKRTVKHESIRIDWIHFFRFVDYFCMIFYNIFNLIVTLIFFYTADRY